MEQGSTVASGKISIVDPTSQREFFYEEIRDSNPKSVDGELMLESQDIYKEFRLKGYDYGKEFR